MIVLKFQLFELMKHLRNETCTSKIILITNRLGVYQGKIEISLILHWAPLHQKAVNSSRLYRRGV